MVAHFISFLFTCYIIYVAWPGSSLFSWHPTLMAVAFVLLMFEGILVFSPQSSLFQSASRQTKVKIHWLFQATAVTCAIAGFFIIFFNKHLNQKSHFTSWHGCIGLITVIYICLQSTGGAFVKYPALAQAIRMKLADLKLYHATSGAIAFTLVCVSLFLGMCSSWFSGIVTGTSWYGCLCCVSCMAMISINQLTAKYVNRSQKKA